MKVTRKLVFAASFGIVAAGCGGESVATDVDQVATTSPASASEENAATAPEKTFDRERFRGKECVVLGAAEVAEIAGIASGKVSESPAVKCLFSWSDGSAIVQLTAHDTAERARQHFGTFTEDVTAEEMKAAKIELDQKLEEKVAEGEMSDEKAEIGSRMAHQIPEIDITHQALAGLGDDASVDSRGKIMIRLGNVTFNVGAKSGGADDIDSELSKKIAERVVNNLEEM